jgi:hypothetical protein
MYSSDDMKNLYQIAKFLDQHHIEYSTEYHNFCLHFGNPNGRRSYEICYVPSRHYPIAYEKYGIGGVEMDYFFKQSYHAEHHQNSFKCWVKDFEWTDPRKREVLKSYFLYAADKITHKFHARECAVATVDPKTARQFERENCFHGARGASLSLGLYTKKHKHGIAAGTLIQLYTFGRNFFGRDDSIEILRAGTLKFASVAGGASKLLNHFLKNYPVLKIGQQLVPVTKLKFYSDYDHNIGQSLENLGFEFVNYSRGGFMNLWLDTGEIKSREPARHQWVMQQMAQQKVLSIPNAGVKTFVMHVQ